MKFQLKFFQASLVGFPIVIFITIILAGGIQNAFLMMALSVICTMGVGGVFWWGAAWVVGRSLLAIYDLAKGTEQQPALVAVSADLSAEQQALVDYIRRSLNANASESQIKTRLRAKGWSDGDIEAAYQQINQDLRS